MNFQDLKKIEKPEIYLDIAFRRAKDRAGIKRMGLKKGLKRIDKSKNVELERISVAKQSLIDNLDKIIKSYPSLDDLPEFYKELINVTLDYVLLKKSLGAVNSAKLVINDIFRKYGEKIRKCQDVERISSYKREFYGRVSSVPKRIRKELAYLEEARKVMRRYPAIKTGLPTIAIAGFPRSEEHTSELQSH